MTAFNWIRAAGEAPVHKRPVRGIVPAILLIVTGIILPALLALGLGVISDVQVVAIVIAVIGLAVILSRPFVGLVIFVALLFTRPEETIKPLDGMHLTLLVAVVTLIGMLLQMSQKREPFVRTPLIGLLFGFCFAAVLSAVPAGTVGAAVMDIMRLVMLAVLVLNLVRTRSSYHHLVTALLLFTTYLALYTIYLFHSGMVIHQDNVDRTEATGIFSDPNDLAATFVGGLALTISRVILTPGIRRSGYVGLSGILLYAIGLTNSRGGILALIALLFGYLMTSKLATPVKMGLIALAVLAVLGAGGRMTNFDSHEASANSRFWFWANGCSMLLAHPLLGVGYDQFMSNNGGMTAHNSFVLCFAELGMAGYYCWMGCIYCCFRSNGTAEGESELTEGDRGEIFGCRMALVAYLVASFWLSHTYSPILFVYLSLPVAASMVLGSREAINWRDDGLSWRNHGAIALLCVTSFLFISALSERLR